MERAIPDRCPIEEIHDPSGAEGSVPGKAEPIPGGSGLRVDARRHSIQHFAVVNSRPSQVTGGV
jgi:hypothetical protein